MKKTLLTLAFTAFLAATAPVSAQVVIAGFDRFNDPFSNQVTSAPVTLPGISATLTVSGTGTSDWYRSNTGSNDGTFGPDLTGADNTTTTSYFGALTTTSVNDQSGFYLDISLSNGSAEDITLESLAFDVWRDFDGGPPRWDLSVVSGDLTVGYVGQTAFISQKNGSPLADNANDYADLNMVTLGGLTDNTLAVGESAVLRLQVWESSFTLSRAGVTRIDNIGVVAVPEPSAYVLFLGFTVLGLVLLRRRSIA